jgi:AcrR family transcriptional regulator
MFTKGYGGFPPAARTKMNDVQSKHGSRPTERGGKAAERAERILAAAEAIIERDGVGAVSARAVADAAGVSVGLIYRDYGDLDGLVLHANSRFIASLDAAMAQAARSGDGLAGTYVSLALGYLRFALANRNRWKALFEHRMQGARPIPEWHLAEHVRMFRHVAEPLGIAVPGLSEEDRAALARTIYSSVHGIVSLGIETRLERIAVGDLERQIDVFVRSLAAGLVATLADAAEPV